MRAWKMRLEQSRPGGREGNIIELTLLLAFSEDRLGEQLYTFSDVSSIYRDILILISLQNICDFWSKCKTAKQQTNLIRFFGLKSGFLGPK